MPIPRSVQRWNEDGQTHEKHCDHGWKTEQYGQQWEEDNVAGTISWLHPAASQFQYDRGYPRNDNALQVVWLGDPHRFATC